MLERQKLDQMVQRTLAENSRLRQGRFIYCLTVEVLVKRVVCHLWNVMFNCFCCCKAVHESEKKQAELQETDTQLRHELDEKTAEVTSLKCQAVESAALVANVDSLISERDSLIAKLQSRCFFLYDSWH